MSSLFHKAVLDGIVEVGLPRTAVMDHQDISQYVPCRNPLDYDFLKSNILSAVSGKETFSVGSSVLSGFTPKKIIQRSEAGQRKIENKIDGFGFAALRTISGRLIFSDGRLFLAY